MTARPQDVALLPCPCGKPARMSVHDSAGRRSAHCDDEDCFWMVTAFTDEQVTERWNRRSAALASAQAREEELRAEVERLRASARSAGEAMGVEAEARADAEWKVVQLAEEALKSRERAERLEEALRLAKRHARLMHDESQHEVVCIPPDKWRELCAALSTNAATQTGETT